MKRILLLLLCLSFFYDCKESPKAAEEIIKKDTEINTPLEGSWEMIGYYNYKDNKVIDSFKTRDGHRQVKMFSDGKVMWSKLVPTDSTEWFGYGSYVFNDSTLTEIMDYGSKMMNTVIAEKKEFKYRLIFEDNKFTQIELDEDGNLVYSENYVRIE